MKLLLIGSGGREHALAWKLKQSPLLDRLYCAPGNAGIADIADCIDLDVSNHAAVARFCKETAIDLVVVGPEVPLVAGLADDLERLGIKVFGPSKAAARLEGSKGFTKDLCAAHGIPTAAYRRFDDASAAKAYLAKQTLPIVIKADGLAAGKGVTIAETKQQANEAIDDCFAGGFGEVVIEEFLHGEEASFFALVDGKTALPLATAQDHKRAFDGDQGPNTGGMGAYSPAPIMTPELCARVMREIIEPTVAAMAEARGTPFKGVLYAGLMIEDGAPKLIEYNVRFGDPEAQALMLRLKSDLLPALLATAEGRLGRHRASLARRACALRGDGGEGLSRRLRQRIGDQRARRGCRRSERADFPCRHETGGSPHPRRWRPRARRDRAGARHRRGASPRLCGNRQDRLAARLLPPRYRLASGQQSLGNKRQASRIATTR